MRTTLAVALALGIACSGAAQPTLGLRAGANTSSWTGDGSDGSGSLQGFTGGLSVRSAITQTTGVQGEIAYSTRGARLENGIGDYTVRYVDVPVLLTVDVLSGSPAGAGIYAGPTVSVPLGAEFEYADGVTGAEGFEDSFELNANTYVGLALGTRAYVGPVGLDLRYEMGLSAIYGDDAVPRENTANRGLDLDDLRSRTLSVSLGYRFGGPSARRY